MKAKTQTIIRWALLLYVAACFGTIVAKEVRARNAPAPGPAAAQTLAQARAQSAASPSDSSARALPFAQASPALASSSAPTSSTLSTKSTSSSLSLAGGPAGGNSREKVIATYFHGKFRCPTCRAIEAQAKEAVQQGLSSLVAEGAIEWRVVDFDQPGGQHYLLDYNLSTQSLILSLQKDGKELRWKNLERVWELVHTPPEFSDYVQGETRKFLGRE